MKKFNIKLLACTGILLSSSVFAEEHPPVEFSANVGYFTDYIYRGGSQTADGPAIQGGFDLGHESGFYLGTWASNVDFGNSAEVEIDFYGGFGGELPNGEKFGDVHGLKAALMKQERQVAASLFEGLLCYALGRDVSFTDRPIIEKALNELEKEKYPVRDMIKQVVLSKPFSRN